MTTQSITYRAAWIVPVQGPPIRHGCVTIIDGKIAGVRKTTSSRVRELGNVAILPGLINAHTHLEFSELTAPLAEPSVPFPEWIRRVIQYRRARDADAAAALFRRHQSIAAGLRELRSSGTAAVGEIATPGWSPAALEGSPCDVTAFLELIGLSANRIEPLRSLGEDHFRESLRSSKEPTRLGEAILPSSWRPGLSPHAPYTVHPQLLDTACRLSSKHGMPLAMHLAETIEELELLSAGTGPLVDLLSELGFWDATAIPRGSRPSNYLWQLSKAHRALVIHGNYLSASEISFLAEHRSQMSIVYCPRTCHYFGHQTYPLRELLKSDVLVALGTDSRASNPNLNVFEEMQFLAQAYPDVSPEQIIRMGTIHGAAALGLEGYGTIEVGKAAHFALVALPTDSTDDVYTTILHPESGVLVGVLSPES